MNLTSVAYTYNEPLMQAEFIVEAAPIARERKIATVLVTNGMFSETALEDLTPWIDAVNIDLKTFNRKKYAQMGGSLKAVQHSISHMVKAGIHVELTNLIVPGISDDRDEFAEMVEWIAALSTNIPLHISRYFPAHKYTEPPTDVNLMKTFRNMAKGRLRHVHLGNVRDESNLGPINTIENGHDEKESLILDREE
jgi:pyruvate formate lyase activating enzyme